MLTYVNELTKKVSSILSPMNQPVHKLLSIMLIFLLGFSPLQSVFAELPVPVDQTNIPCNNLTADSMSEVFQLTESNCEMCSTADECDNSCAQSVTSVIALLHNSSTISNTTSLLNIIQTNETPINQQPPSLFRPPRV